MHYSFRTAPVAVQDLFFGRWEGLLDLLSEKFPVRIPEPLYALLDITYTKVAATFGLAFL